MEVSAEAKRIMVVALGKLYSSRTQRGGLRLHRSLLLTLVMKSARDMYHAAQATADSVAPACEPLTPATTEPSGAHPEPQGPSSPAHTRTGAEDKENRSPAKETRKRRGKVAAEPDFLPCKKLKLEQTSCPQQLSVNPVLMDYVNCGNELPPPPVPLHRAVAAC
ncbi:hypothetical protein L3Q82_002784 [Scortum barcoo]|uniref:Uncharacterized protein n=1 Tax=Scortum barcoo TaxID=214431 RepID=A0ACB8VV53_9TELE|nr:hypothetical protein L3Q82_002784 [Scortum barcoo]